MDNAADWRTESRTVYSNDFKLRIVELASQPDANVAKIARKNGVAHNLIFEMCRRSHQLNGLTGNQTGKWRRLSSPARCQRPAAAHREPVDYAR